MSAQTELARQKLDTARTDEPIAYVHTAAGLRPVGPDGWPIEDEDYDPDDDQRAVGLFDSGEIVDVEPVSVVDIETTS